MCWAAPWRDLPERFGKWKSTYSAFRRFVENGLFEAVLAGLLRIGVDLEMGGGRQQRMPSPPRRLRSARRAAGPDHGKVQGGGLSTKIHMAYDTLGYPFGFHLTPANESDYNNCKLPLESYLDEGSFALMDKTLRQRGQP